MSDPWIEGIPPRAERTAPRIDVLTPTFHYPVDVTLLTNKLYVRIKHYNKETRRPWVCPGRSHCTTCQAGGTRYPTGFIACCSVRSRRLFIAQLSDAALACLEEFVTTAPLLRGLLLRTKRADTRRNAKMTAEICGRDERDDLPEEFDPRPTLELMWGHAETRKLTAHELGGPHDTKKARKSRRER